MLANVPTLALQHDMDSSVAEPDPCRHDLVHTLAQLGQRVRPQPLALR